MYNVLITVLSVIFAIVFYHFYFKLSTPYSPKEEISSDVTYYKYPEKSKVVVEFENQWYAKVKINMINEKSYYYTALTPFQMVHADKPPELEDWEIGKYAWLGTFHCSECCIDCVSFGKTDSQAFEGEHTTEDAKFALFLNIY